MNDATVPCSCTRRSTPDRGARPKQVVDVAVPLFADGCAIDVVRRSAFVRIAETSNLDHVSKSWSEIGTARRPSGRRAEIVSATGVADPSVIVAPVIVRGSLRGRILFQSGVRRYTTTDLVTAESFARLAAISLDRRRVPRGERDVCRGCAQMLATVAHDLRNPLAVIHGTVALLRENLGNEHAARRLATVDRTVRFMNTLISDLLDTAAARAGGLRVQPARESVSSIVDETIAAFLVLTELKEILFVADHEDPDAMAFCDRTRVLQVLGNLIGNAIKFSEKGSSLTVMTRLTGDSVRFSVIDTGCGISETDCRRVFDRFWSGTPRKPGVGLGLAIAKSIVEAHGGKIGVVSRPNKGSTFWFTLPVTPSSQRASRA